MVLMLFRISVSTNVAFIISAFYVVHILIMYIDARNVNAVVAKLAFLKKQWFPVNDTSY